MARLPFRIISTKSEKLSSAFVSKQRLELALNPASKIAPETRKAFERASEIFRKAGIPAFGKTKNEDKGY